VLSEVSSPMVQIDLLTEAKGEIIRKYKIKDSNLDDGITISYAKLNGKSPKDSFFKYYVEGSGASKVFIIEI
jgi:hypothetical protein